MYYLYAMGCKLKICDWKLWHISTAILHLFYCFIKSRRVHIPFIKLYTRVCIKSIVFETSENFQWSITAEMNTLIYALFPYNLCQQPRLVFIFYCCAHCFTPRLWGRDHYSCFESRYIGRIYIFLNAFW